MCVSTHVVMIMHHCINLRKNVLRVIFVPFYISVCISDINTGNKSFESMAKFRYLGTTLTNQNSLYEELRADSTQGTPATIQSRIFCLFICCPET